MNAHHDTNTSDAVPSVPAVINGAPLDELPTDLYIPPQALRVFLQQFEGPLDLLLYLVRKRSIDILLVDIVQVTEQYVAYVNMMEQLAWDNVANYLLIAATLIEIRSRALLPPPIEDTPVDELSPEEDLLRRLRAYLPFREVVKDLDALPQIGRDTCMVSIPFAQAARPPTIAVHDLSTALNNFIARNEAEQHYFIAPEKITTESKVQYIVSRVHTKRKVALIDLLEAREGRMGLVTVFIAMMELVKRTIISLVQQKPYAPIYLRDISSKR